MIEELDAASALLQESLRRYREACSSIQKSYLESQTPDGIPPELSSRLSKELPRILSYETKIKEAKSAVSWARNCSPSIVPINVLPADLITRIFEFFLELYPCTIKHQTRGFDEDGEISFPNSNKPMVLSHVCSRWREIALNTRTLWSHIDLSPYPPIIKNIVSRAEAYAERAGQSPLDVHVVDSTAYGGLPKDDRLIQLLASIAGRIRSLKFETRHTTRSGDFCRTVLQTCFAFCVPGTLRQLTLQGDPLHQTSFSIQPIDNPIEGRQMIGSITLELPRDTIDNLLFAVPVMKLNGFFPFWTSKAYQGLSELRLSGKSGSIPESAVLAVLKSSPHLRVLKFDFRVDIFGRLPDGATISPARLEDLEILIVGSVHEEDLALFLRLIAPGPKPLTLSLERRAETLHFAHPEIHKFFSRSSVANLCGSGFSGLDMVFELLSLAPNPRALALHQFSSLTGHEMEDEEEEMKPLPITEVRLDVLYLLDCGEYEPCDAYDLKDLVETYHIQEIVVWRYHLESFETYDGLTGICPNVTIIPDEYPNPVEDWW